MNKIVSIYLGFRKCIFFLVNPLFYVLVIASIVGLAYLTGRDGRVNALAASCYRALENLTSELFFMGMGHQNPDILMIVTITMPTITAVSFLLIERVTGVHYLLKRNGFI